MNRRQSLGVLGAFAASLSFATETEASTARAVTLRNLVSRSTRIVRGSALDSFARAEDVGDVRHIVTYTRLRVDDLILGGPVEPELLIRTLGGRLGTLGELVHGEAALALSEPCLVFVHANAEGIDQVTAMAQGHFPISNDARGTARLSPSRNMSHLLAVPDAAVALLSGAEVGAARELILRARP